VLQTTEKVINLSPFLIKAAKNESLNYGQTSRANN
jgi:hypothetical protein